MNKLTYTLVLCLCSLCATAQKVTPVEGSVSDGLQPLEGVHIVNVSTDKFSISNREGRFSISLSQGDTLVFSHISMQDLIRIVGEEELTKATLSAVMLERSNELDEVLLQKDRDYALELGIISKRNKPLSTYERKLKAESEMGPAFGLTSISVPLVPLLNAINGRTKQLKRNREAEKKMHNIDFLKQRYLDYMLKTFDSPKTEIEPFLDHLVEQESLEAVMRTDNPDQMKFYLIEEWFKFRER